MAEKNITLPVINLTGEKVGTISLAASVFGVKEENTQAVHDAVVTYQANLRQATAKTKKRHDVNGSGIKPWRQKGTGRARSGDRQSPIWVGGGNVFGPDGTQNYKLSQNKKAHKLALCTVLSEKAKKGLIIVDDLSLNKVSTKDFTASLKAIKAEGKVLLITSGENQNLILSARNAVGIDEPSNVAVYDVLNFDTIVVSKEDIKAIEEALK